MRQRIRDNPVFSTGRTRGWWLEPSVRDWVLFGPCAVFHITFGGTIVSPGDRAPPN
jgi:hypothetical protein